MFYDELVPSRGLKDSRGQFFALLSQGRYDAALFLRKKEDLGDEVFFHDDVREAGRRAVALAFRIGDPGDADRMRKAFFLSRDVYHYPDVATALRGKREFYRLAGYQKGTQIMDKLYVC